MNKNQSILVVAILFVAFVAASYAIYKNKGDDELKVYIAFFDDPFIKPYLDKVVFASTVSMCGVELRDLKEDEYLFNSMKMANSDSAQPRSLSKLTTHAHVVEHQIAEMLHKKRLTGVEINPELRNLSRVGFNKSRDKAVFCVEDRHSAAVIISSKKPSGNWKTDDIRMLWIQ